VTIYECVGCGGPREAGDDGCSACGEQARLVKKQLTATVTTRATITRRVTNVVYVVRRVPAAAATTIAGAAPLVGSLLKTKLAHHGPLGDAAEQATNRGGVQAANALMRRAVKRVTRTTIYDH
jgi:hypothetical protein